MPLNQRRYASAMRLRLEKLSKTTASSMLMNNTLLSDFEFRSPHSQHPVSQQINAFDSLK